MKAHSGVEPHNSGVSNEVRHWSENPLWTDALERYQQRRNSGAKAFEIDMVAVEELLFSAETPAYEFMEAMSSVKALEGWEGHRGAPRLILALLELLHQRSACR